MKPARALFLVALVASLATPAAAEDTGFKPPPGFKAKKRGDLVVYCSSTSEGNTRLKRTVCYDEKQMRAFMLAHQQDKADIDRMRSTQGVWIN
jgi:hypothetical protein